ncbi:MAG: baseplate J/gp47 family protein, partial [Blastocatellia bacterium]
MASATLSFTKLDAYLNQDLLIPAGTPIVSLDGLTVLTTDQALTIPNGTGTSTMTATAAVAGNIPRVLAGAAWRPQVPIAGILSVTNSADLSGGRDAETVAQAALRARESMRIGQHLGSPDDYVTYVTLWILHGVGRVTVFEQFRGDFSLAGPGYALVTVQSDGGLAPDIGTLNQVSQLISDRHVAGITVIAVPPLYKRFSIQANVVVTPQT